MSASFNKLKKQWYDKLKQSGFTDIEKPNGQIGRTKLNLTNRTHDQLELTYQYYSMARSFLIDHKFTDELEKTIWEYYSEGLSYRDISEALKKVGIINKKKDAVRSIIKRLEKLMKKRYLSF